MAGAPVQTRRNAKGTPGRKREGRLNAGDARERPGCRTLPTKLMTSGSAERYGSISRPQGPFGPYLRSEPVVGSSMNCEHFQAQVPSWLRGAKGLMAIWMLPMKVLYQATCRVARAA